MSTLASRVQPFAQTPLWQLIGCDHEFREESVCQERDAELWRCTRCASEKIIDLHPFTRRLRVNTARVSGETNEAA